MLAKGYIQTLLAAGATLTASGCAACLGIHQGLLAADEVCLSSTNRNFPGRMGSVKGAYLSWLAGLRCRSGQERRGDRPAPVSG